jgi:hypothetical protein
MYSAGKIFHAGSLYRRIPLNDQAHWFAPEKRPTKYKLMPASSHDHLSMQFVELVAPDEIFEQHLGSGLLEIDVQSPPLP